MSLLSALSTISTFALLRVALNFNYICDVQKHTHTHDFNDAYVQLSPISSPYLSHVQSQSFHYICKYYIEKKEEKNPSVGQFFVFLFVLWTGTVFSYTKKCRIVHHIECIQKTCKWIKGFRFLDSFLNESHFAAIKKRFTQRLQSENNINWCTRPIATGFSQWIPFFLRNAYPSFDRVERTISTTSFISIRIRCDFIFMMPFRIYAVNVSKHWKKGR